MADDARDKPHGADTEAILRRRRFLIQSALTGLGAAALLAACDSQPEVCLKPLPPKPKTGVKPKTETLPQPCLELPPPEKPTTATAPGPCLDIAPQPCLSPPAPKPSTKAKVCLSLERVE